MEPQGAQGSQEPQGHEPAKATGQITVSRAVKKELQVLMIRMDLKSVGEVVGILLKYYQETHDPWVAGGVTPQTKEAPLTYTHPIVGKEPQVLPPGRY